MQEAYFGVRMRLCCACMLKMVRRTNRTLLPVVVMMALLLVQAEKHCKLQPQVVCTITFTGRTVSQKSHSLISETEHCCFVNEWLNRSRKVMVSLKSALSKQSLHHSLAFYS